MANLGGKITMKALCIGIGIPTGIAVRKVVEKVWVVSGPDRPHRATDNGVQWMDAVSWAALTGVGMSMADLLTRKAAEEVYRTLGGTHPPASIRPKASRRVSRASPKYPEAIAPPS